MALPSSLKPYNEKALIDAIPFLEWQRQQNNSTSAIHIPEMIRQNASHLLVGTVLEVATKSEWWRQDLTPGKQVLFSGYGSANVGDQEMLKPGLYLCALDLDFLYGEIA